MFVYIVVIVDIVEGDDEVIEDNKYVVLCVIYFMWLVVKELGFGFVWRIRGVGFV